MKITDGEKTMTLEELAQKICDSHGECTEGECVGFDYCSKNKNGVLVWLQKVIANEHD